MKGAKESAVMKAVTLLFAAGADFKIFFDGKEYGELEMGRRKDRRNRNFCAIYKPVLDGLTPGGCVVLVTPEGVESKDLRNAATTYMIANWGKGSFVTAAKKNDLEILRVA